MRVMSADDGYKYLLRTVVAGDGDRQVALYAVDPVLHRGGHPVGSKRSCVRVCVLARGSLSAFVLVMFPQRGRRHRLNSHQHASHQRLTLRHCQVEGELRSIGLPAPRTMNR